MGRIVAVDCGNSDSEAFSENENWKYIFAEGMLGIHPFALCPHYNEEGRDSFDRMMKEKEIVGLALENETAFVDENGAVSFIRSRKGARAYEISYQNGMRIKREMAFADFP